MTMSSSRPVRVGAVSFINTLPLIHGLDQPGWPQIVLSLAPPAQLAEQMAAGQLDVGLIPIVEHFRARDYQLITQVGITSRGPVDTVAVYCRKPMEKVETLSADVRSRSSVALARVWFAKARNREIRVAATHDPTTQLAEDTDAILVIGEHNWRIPREGWADVIDLGAAWCELTGLGFVYAGWSARAALAGEVLGALDARLTAAKEAGVAAVDALAARAAPGAGVPVSRVREYLTRNIRFDIEESERVGMELFREWCGEMNLLGSPGGLGILGL